MQANNQRPFSELLADVAMANVYILAWRPYELARRKGIGFCEWPQRKEIPFRPITFAPKTWCRKTEKWIK